MRSDGFVVVVHQQVLDYIRSLPPETRSRMKRAIRDLAEEKGDIEALDSNLTGYLRLRVGTHRVIFFRAESRKIEVFFAEHRSVVYLMLERLLEAGLQQNDKS